MDCQRAGGARGAVFAESGAAGLVWRGRRAVCGVARGVRRAACAVRVVVPSFDFLLFFVFPLSSK